MTATQKEDAGRAGHTPLPWAIGYSDQSGCEFIVGAEKAIATLRWGCSCCKVTPDNFLDMDPEERANAAFIVRAVNSHADLVAGLRAAICDLAMIGRHFHDCAVMPCTCGLDKTRDLVSEALAKASP